MRQLRAWFLRLSGLFGKERREQELAEEMEGHLQLHIEDNLRTGMSAEEARRNALIKLGGIEQRKVIASAEVCPRWKHCFRICGLRCACF
jgi:macrolide transport system ATP-binding/permease protein